MKKLSPRVRNEFSRMGSRSSASAEERKLYARKVKEFKEELMHFPAISQFCASFKKGQGNKNRTGKENEEGIVGFIAIFS